MTEFTEQQTPVTSRPSLFGRLIERLRGKPSPTVETPPPISPQPKPRVTLPVSPVTEEPKIPRALRRAEKQAEYERWKAATRQDEPDNTPPAVARPAVTETKPKPANLPQGIKDRERFSRGLLITKAEMPWLGERDSVQVELDLMTLDTTKGEQFLYGSLIHGKKLTGLLRQMTKNELGSVDKLLFVQLSELMQKMFAPDIEMIHNHRTARPIFETGNQRGVRVYFMRFDNIQDIPVIIRVAVVKDHKIMEALSVISTENRRQTGRGGGK